MAATPKMAMPASNNHGLFIASFSEEGIYSQSTQKNTKAQKPRKFYATGCLLA
jgi:hypothetical protein